MNPNVPDGKQIQGFIKIAVCLRFEAEALLFMSEFAKTKSDDIFLYSKMLVFLLDT